MTDVDALLDAPRGRGACLALAARIDEQVWGALAGGSVDGLIAALSGVAERPVDEADVVAALERDIGNAMYWQAPLDEDVLAARPEVVTALRPIAKALLGSPPAAWWGSGVDLGELRHVAFAGRLPTAAPVLVGASGRLDRWRADTLADERRSRAERPSDVRAAFSGQWWSTPALASMVGTTRPVAGIGAAALAWREDETGEQSATVRPLRATRPPRVWEVDGPAAWAELVARYPLEVTHARRHDWFRVTGRDGRWLIPDWPAAAADLDAVHVSVLGYLTTATRAVPVADGATMLAGWSPDLTVWLADVLEPDGPGVEWWADDTGPDRVWTTHPPGRTT